MEIKLTTLTGKTSTKTIKLLDDVFAAEYKLPTIHQVVTAYQTNARAGTRAQKSRSDVKATGAKPWSQKGTGRARAGSYASPIWRSGGVTFAAQPKDYNVKVNKKMYRAAMRSIVSELIRQDRLMVVEKFEIAEPKTKLMLKQLEALNVKNVLIINDTLDSNLYLAARNIANVQVIEVMDINPVDLIAYDHIIVNQKAVKAIEERLK